MTGKLLTIAIIIAANVLVYGTNEDDEYHDFDAGTDFPFSGHSNFPIPDGYLPDVREDFKGYSGTFEGNSEYPGDRRFDAFESSYRVVVKIASRSDVSVKWTCMQRGKGSSGWKNENPKMFIKEGRYGSLMVWGNMYFISVHGKELVTRPFLALFVENIRAHTRGLLLVDRREGSVFLKRVE